MSTNPWEEVAIFKDREIEKMRRTILFLRKENARIRRELGVYESYVGTIQEVMDTWRRVRASSGIESALDELVRQGVLKTRIDPKGERVWIDSARAWPARKERPLRYANPNGNETKEV